MPDESSVSCRECGQLIDARTDQPPEQRTPCPFCGSQARLINTGASDRIELRHSLETKLRRRGSGKVAQRQRVGLVHQARRRMAEGGSRD